MTSVPKKSERAKAARTPRGSRTKSPAPTAAQPAAQPQASGTGAAEAKVPEATGGGSAARAWVRVYCQGLGDCILVRVKREDADDFKLMIDCGVVLGTDDAGAKMTGVVENILKDTNQKVDVLVITHEHWDHLSGFIQADDSFSKLAVGSVWVAWTEDPDDKLANELRDELGKAEKALAACAAALQAAGDGATPGALADIALSPLGAAASSSTSTRAAFEAAKAKAKVRLCRPTDPPLDIPGTNARIYVLGPPHDPTLIRKINPSTTSPETYGLAMNGDGALSIGIVEALANPPAANGQTAPVQVDKAAPFHQRVTIPLGPKGRPLTYDSHSVVEEDWRRNDDFLREHYSGSASDDWRRIDGDWLGSSTELALALQSYTNNTSLVLALELGDPGKGNVLLFAADAQVGNWESWQTWQCQIDGATVTGPDLLKRTIFYKVGHHGSHNATLKGHGLEQMDALKAAIIPVDEVEAKKKRWGSMPLPDLISALEQKAPGMVLRTDKKPAQPPQNVVMGENYFEIQL